MRPLHLLASSTLCLGFSIAVPAGAQQAAAAAQATAPAQQSAPQQQASQQPASPRLMGTVATQDALVSGGLNVQDEKAELVSNASVTAHDRTAVVRLARGGEVLVCATSQLHLLHSGNGNALLFGLDRGALQIHTVSEGQDVILTPDIRFTIQTPGKFDLRLRVTRDGDTCVDNAGSEAPVLMLSDAFSQASYQLLPKQHVLFEHGNLHEVVDNEEFSCGCPADVTPLESAGLSGPAAAAAAQHPFPEAASEGLAPESPPSNSIPAGEKHTQIAATLSYAEGQPPPPSTLPAPVKPAPPPAPALQGSAASGPLAPPPSPPGAHRILRAIGHFFHRLFNPDNPPASPQS